MSQVLPLPNPSSALPRIPSLPGVLREIGSSVLLSLSPLWGAGSASPLAPDSPSKRMPAPSSLTEKARATVFLFWVPPLPGETSSMEGASPSTVRVTLPVTPLTVTRMVSPSRAGMTAALRGFQPSSGSFELAASLS